MPVRTSIEPRIVSKVAPIIAVIGVPDGSDIPRRHLLLEIPGQLHEPVIILVEGTELGRLFASHPLEDVLEDSETFKNLGKVLVHIRDVFLDRLQVTAFDVPEGLRDGDIRLIGIPVCLDKILDTNQTLVVDIAGRGVDYPQGNKNEEETGHKHAKNSRESHQKFPSDLEIAELEHSNSLIAG